MIKFNEAFFFFPFLVYIIVFVQVVGIIVFHVKVVGQIRK